MSPSLRNLVCSECAERCFLTQRCIKNVYYKILNQTRSCIYCPNCVVLEKLGKKGTSGSQKNNPGVFPTGLSNPPLPDLPVYPHDYGMGEKGHSSHLLDQFVALLVPKLQVPLRRATQMAFVGMPSTLMALLFFLQWPIPKTLTTLRRSLSFTAINAGSRARVKCFGFRPNISTSNVSPAKVWHLLLVGLLTCHSQSLSWAVPSCSLHVISECTHKPWNH